VINRSGENDGLIRDYCAEEKIGILACIPDDRAAAEACSRGECAPYFIKTYSAELAAIAGNIGLISTERVGS
jgi:MinD superfamily P-loop ATPase